MNKKKKKHNNRNNYKYQRNTNKQKNNNYTNPPPFLQAEGVFCPSLGVLNHFAKVLLCTGSRKTPRTLVVPFLCRICKCPSTSVTRMHFYLRRFPWGP